MRIDMLEFFGFEEEYVGVHNKISKFSKQIKNSRDSKMVMGPYGSLEAFLIFPKFSHY